MSQLTPVSSHHSRNAPPSVLMVNGDASYESLSSAADQRLSAASDLLETIAIAADESSSLSGRDMRSVAWAAHLLTSDALDLLRVSVDAHSSELAAEAEKKEAK